MVYSLMNGSIGCLPDNAEMYDSKADAIDRAGDLFDDLPDDEWNDMRENLARYDIHYFSDSQVAGADYVQVAVCEFFAEE